MIAIPSWRGLKMFYVKNNTRASVIVLLGTGRRKQQQPVK